MSDQGGVEFAILLNQLQKVGKITLFVVKFHQIVGIYGIQSEN
ncbi:Uncharacterised protein [Moraxella cuniculi]|uniref:Uncharacterized protein n=1 Tax=Moraxella cuniculi TaxID=34061 RepID=A0A3S5EFU1_9GAMM|nr:Uncharacterised protein [Moraxella cuniculi]